MEPSDGQAEALLEAHLKALRLPTFLREYDKVARQCAQEELDWDACGPLQRSSFPAPSGPFTPPLCGLVLLRRLHSQLLVENLHILARPAEIAHRFLFGVGNPNLRELAGPIQLRQAQAISPIRLDAFARLAGNQRRRDNSAVVSCCDELSVEVIAARAGLVAKPQRRGAPTQPRQQLLTSPG